MSTVFDSNALDRLFDPLGDCLTPEVARRIVDLRVDAGTQEKLNQLADKCTEGTLTPSEKTEYDTLIGAITFVSVLQAKARQIVSQEEPRE